MAEDVDNVTIAEYNALRSEIQGRMQIQQGIVGLAVTGIGVAGGVALDGKPEVMVLVPLLTMMLGHAHLGHARGIRRISRYITDELASGHATLLGRWEQHLRGRSFMHRLGASIPYMFVLAGGPLAAAIYVIATEDIPDEGWWLTANLVMAASLALTAIVAELNRKRTTGTAQPPRRQASSD